MAFSSEMHCSTAKIRIIVLIALLTSANGDNRLSGRFRLRSACSGPPTYSRLGNVTNVANPQECGRICLNYLHCTIYEFDTNRACALYSHSVYNGTLERLNCTGKQIFELFNDLNTQEESYANETYPQDCTDLWNSGQRTSGAYLVRPRNMGDEVVPVYCDMDDYPGGWTVIHKRFDGSVQFHDRTYSEYENFFGDPWGEYWAGLKTMNHLTDVNMASTVLKVELEGGNGQKKFALYDGMVVQAESMKYKLYISGYCASSTLLDEMSSVQNSMYWTAKDEDNDVSASNCALLHGSGWWWNNCTEVALNSKYSPDNISVYGVNYWRGFYASDNIYRGLKGSVMKIRRFAVKSEDVYTSYGQWNFNMEPCRFPFVYNGVTLNTCTTHKHNRPWCYTTDTAGYWGNCQTEHDCKDYYFRRGCLENRHCYRMVTQATDPQTSHDNANAACKAQHPNGHLVNLETAEENAWFMNERRQYAAKNEKLMIGLRKDGNGVWRWYKPNNTVSTFQSWEVQQPDGNGNCSMLFADPGSWDDDVCTNLNTGYVCEYDDSSYV